MRFLGLMLVIITFYSVGAEGPPRKLSPDGHRRILFAHVTESLTLKCPLELSESPTFVEWMKGNASLYMVQGYEITQKGFLKIKSVTNEHAGTYTCEGINGYGSVRVNLTLIIDSPKDENQQYSDIQPNSSTKRMHTYPPTIVKRPSSAVVDVGGEATYHCVASGQPLPRIFWLKDGQLVENDSSSYISGRRTHSTLKLRSLRKADAGDYKCIARNKIGEDEADVSLYVTEPSPPPRILALDPPSAIIPEGATVAFVCNVMSKPGTQLHIKWLKKYHQETGGNDDVNLFRLESAFYRPLNLTYTVSTHDGVHKSKLLLRNACKGDEGSYICLALNDAGFNFKNSTLTIIQTSTSLSSPSASTASSISLALIVTVVFVILLAVTILVSHLLCRNKSEDKSRQSASKIPDSYSFSIKEPSKEILNHYPEIRDPQYITHLLRTESTFSYENEESQMSKSTHPKLVYHS